MSYADLLEELPVGLRPLRGLWELPQHVWHSIPMSVLPMVHFILMTLASYLVALDHPSVSSSVALLYFSLLTFVTAFFYLYYAMREPARFLETSRNLLWVDEDYLTRYIYRWIPALLVNGVALAFFLSCSDMELDALLPIWCLLVIIQIATVLKRA